MRCVQLGAPRRLSRNVALSAALSLGCSLAVAGGGPLGIDHALSGDGTSGIWSRKTQVALQDVTALAVVAGAIWEGDESRLGHTTWQSVDSVAVGSIAAAVLKVTFSRARPSQTDDPNRWFQGKGHNSFPSGEVMEVSTAVTPFVIEYAHEHPAAWLLELLPVYDSIARVKSRAHWQSDVLASFAIGTGIGAYMHSRPTSLSVGILPRGLTIGWKKSF